MRTGKESREEREESGKLYEITREKVAISLGCFSELKSEKNVHI